MMMNQAMMSAAMEPLTASMRCRTKLSSSACLSTTLLCAKKIIQGAMVVPMVATTSEIYEGSSLTLGTSVAKATSPQLGPAMKAATMYVTKTQLTSSRIFSMR